MLNAMTDVPPSVIGFEVAGKLTAEDYHEILLPAIQNAAASGGVKIVIVMPAFEGFAAGAFWQDLKMGIENWRAWSRIALVTDVDWMRRGTEWFGWMTPGDVKHFPLDQRAQAIDWAAGE
jgi:hypothetical protein